MYIRDHVYKSLFVILKDLFAFLYALAKCIIYKYRKPIDRLLCFPGLPSKILLEIIY
jgi:hypothetical protein